MPLTTGNLQSALLVYNNYYKDWRVQNPDAGEIPIFDEKTLKKIKGLRPHRSDQTFNLHRDMHDSVNTPSKIGAMSANIGGLGNTAVQVSTNSQGFVGLGVAAATGGAIAISATGIGLLVVSGVLIIVQCSLAVRASFRTDAHIKFLTQLFYAYKTNRDGIGNDICPDTNSQFTHYLETGEKPDMIIFNNPRSIHHQNRMTVHDIILNFVLPYIIEKKTRKLGRKQVVATPMLGGMIETLRGTVKTGYKMAIGTKAVHRTNAALFLAYHFQTKGCNLTKMIITDLFAYDHDFTNNDVDLPEEKVRIDQILYDLRLIPIDDLANRLMEKMNSSG